jgi:4-hydroxybutyrate dehydrogenase/sulfolactaldehyde 3-reductase
MEGMTENRSKPAEPLAPGRTRVLFVGLGTMGLPMATNLVRAGFVVTGADVNPASVEAFTLAGGRAGPDVHACGADCDVVVTMLPDDRAVAGVLGGDAGLGARLRPGTLVIEMSTTAPRTKQALAAEARARGVDFIECPVGKTVEHAVAGTLALMAGGDTGSIDRARPLLAAMGNEVHVCGDLGAASAMKLINNALVACINAASIEALVAGSKANLSVGTMMSVLKTTMAWNNALATSLPRKALKRDFRPGFMTRLAHKDVGLALDMARELGAPMHQGEAAFALLREALDAGYGADDTPGSMLRACEARGGVHLVP